MGDFNNVLNPKDKKEELHVSFSHLRGFMNAHVALLKLTSHVAEWG